MFCNISTNKTRLLLAAMLYSMLFLTFCDTTSPEEASLEGVWKARVYGKMATCDSAYNILEVEQVRVINSGYEVFSVINDSVIELYTKTKDCYTISVSKISDGYIWEEELDSAEYIFENNILETRTKIAYKKSPAILIILWDKHDKNIPGPNWPGVCQDLDKVKSNYVFLFASRVKLI